MPFMQRHAIAIFTSVLWGLPGLIVLPCLTGLGGLAGSNIVQAQTQAQPQPPSLNDLAARYQADDFYQSRVDLSFSTVTGRLTQTEKTYYNLTFDRPAQRLYLVGPQWELFVEADRVQFKSDLFPDVYMDTTISAPFGPDTIDLLAGIAPPAVAPLLPDLALLMQGLSRGLPQVIGDPATATFENNTWVAHVAGTTHQLKIDPQTQRITERSIQSTQQHGTSQSQISTTFSITNVTVGQALPDHAFAFDTTDRAAHSTLHQMVQNSAIAQQQQADANNPNGAGSGGGGAGGAGGAGDSSGGPVAGRVAPDFDLEILDSGGKRFKMADAHDRLIILDFWASWCGPCRLALPHLQTIKQWVDQQQWPVDIYTINVGETPATARYAMQQIGVDLTVLMDTQQTTLPAYGSNVLPTTVIIKNGIIERMHTGFSPNYQQQLRNDIEQLLDKKITTKNPNPKPAPH